MRFTEIIVASAMLSASFTSVTQDVASPPHAETGLIIVISDVISDTTSDDGVIGERSDPDDGKVSDSPLPGEIPDPDQGSFLVQEISDRDYLINTARPGNTMSWQGPEIAIGRLHPEFVIRLASAIREARHNGLPSVGISSAYRPPAFGIGGFLDKFRSLHTYGLAVDLNGIGRPGSAEAVLWHQLAARHGVICPYGPVHRSEWNHCQATPLRLINPENPLRETVTAEGPLSLEEMFEVGNSFMGGKEGGPTREINLPTPSIGRRIPWPRSATKVWTIAKHGHAWRRPHLAGVPRILVEEKIGRRRPGLNSYRLTDLRAKRGRNPNRRVAGWTVHKIAPGIGRS